MLCARAPAAARVRALHTGPVTQDLFSWLKRGKNKEEAVEKPADTKELIGKIESGSSGKQNVARKALKLKLAPNDFVGMEEGQLARQLHRERLEQVQFRRWLSQEKLSKPEELRTHVAAAYEAAFGAPGDAAALEQRFPDLQAMFAFAKHLQASTGYIMPDAQLTRLHTPAAVAQWYERNVLTGKLQKFREELPNAIDLSDADLPANVVVREHVMPKTQRKTLNSVLREVSALEASKAKAALERAKAA
ncbi:AaceriAEL289Wp [[Ashbya] aceris (nom. inval.)]|nr:AaceriAEL289Wp [[Ashbya] aceris (nom. inval.)]